MGKVGHDAGGNDRVVRFQNVSYINFGIFGSRIVLFRDLEIAAEPRRGNLELGGSWLGIELNWIRVAANAKLF